MGLHKGEYTDKITNVCRLLDRKYSKHWHNYVNTDTLDMSSYDNCLLGQLYDGFRRGVQILLDLESLSYAKAEEWGYEHALCAYDGDYERLNSLWVRRIMSRREKEDNETTN